MTWVLTGWSFFIVSALLYLASALRAGDGLAVAGSLAFLAANLAFLVAIWLERRKL